MLCGHLLTFGIGRKLGFLVLFLKAEEAGIDCGAFGLTAPVIALDAHNLACALELVLSANADSPSIVTL